MTNLSIQKQFNDELAKYPDPIEFALVFPSRIMAAIEKSQTPEEANALRAMADMGSRYLRQSLPRVIRKRQERYEYMHPTEKAYILASAKAGVLWDRTDNKMPVGRNWPNSENFQNKQSVSDVGFKGHKDAMTCVRVGELDEQDLQIYFDEMLQEERHTTIHGAERIWHLLNPKPFVEIEGLYRVVYADPPWKYGNVRYRGATEQSDRYSLMTTEQICDIPVVDHVNDDAVLFLWATSPILHPDAFQVIEAWGFEYKAAFIWDKVKHNMGYYNSVRHELLLIATRGSCTPDVTKLYDSVQTIERSKEHSEKPEEFREIIDTLYPQGSRVELFSRKKVKGWNSYGDGIPA